MNTEKEVYGLVDEWLGTVEYRVARSTYVKYEQLARNYILPFFQSMACRELDHSSLERFYTTISRKKSTGSKPLSDGNQRTIFMILNNTLDYAYASRALDQKYYIKPGLTRSRRVVRVFSQEHQKKLEDYILKHPDRYSLAVMLALFLGLRIGEICALQWNDISFETASLYVNRTVQRLRISGENGEKHTQLLVSRPKSAASQRLLPVPAFLLEYLRHFAQGKKGSLSADQRYRAAHGAQNASVSL